MFVEATIPVYYDNAYDGTNGEKMKVKTNLREGFVTLQGPYGLEVAVKASDIKSAIDRVVEDAVG